MECLLGREDQCVAVGDDFQSVVTPIRLDTIRSASKKRGDSIHVYLEEEKENLCHIKIHRKCVSLYTSKSLIHGITKRRTEENFECRSSKQLRSDDIVGSTGSTFNFKKHCLFCFDVSPCFLNSEYSNKISPNRRIPSSLISADKHDHQLLDHCIKRGDKLGRIVKARLEGMTECDLIAAGARYHHTCKANFMYITRDNAPEDTPLLALIDVISNDRSRIWNSLELQHEYERLGGTLIKSRKTLIQHVEALFVGEVIVLSSPGLATLISFSKETAKLLHLHKADDDKDDVENVVSNVARQIQRETYSYKVKRDCYNTAINRDTAREPVSETLLYLLSKVSSKFENTLSALLIGNIVSSVVNCSPTDLQIALGVAMRRNKSLITLFHDFGVCCSYDEVRLFKYSAAVDTVNGLDAHTFDANGNIIHCCADNFDCEISSQNCTTVCHSLAMILAQSDKSYQSEDVTEQPKLIKRLKKEDLKVPINFEVSEESYDGPKNPNMPSDIALRKVPPLAFMCSQIVSVQRASEQDFKFIKDVGSVDMCPEWNGYNAREAKQANFTCGPKAKVAYMPLINKTPASHSTILTAMHKGLSMVNKAGQSVLVFTLDQQLYKVAIDILFNEPSLFGFVIPILGGMHMLMAFIHAISSLMGSQLRHILSSTFGSVDRLMNGKKYPQNLRAFTMIAEVMLNNLLQQDLSISGIEDLTTTLNNRATKSRTTKMWTDCFIKPVLIMLAFIRSAREDDFPLRIATAESMLPYFAAAGSHNYYRNATFFVHHMKSLPQERLVELKNDCSLRIRSGVSNAIFTDQFIESTYMKLGKGPGGAIGLIIKDSQMEIWALSFATCGKLVADIDTMRNGGETYVTVHKEETTSRIITDQRDRQSIGTCLALIIDPLEPDQHPNGSLLNITTGEIASHSVNVDCSLNIGIKMVKDFRRSWPGGFHKRLTKDVITMDDCKKHMKLGGKRLYDPETIYARVIGLASSTRSINIETCLKTEMAPYPPSMFDSAGVMRQGTKSQLKTVMAVNCPAMSSAPADVVIYDVSALLWATNWPNGTLNVYTQSIKVFVAQALVTTDVILIFDRYFDDSTKQYIRALRQEKQGVSRVHVLHPHMPAPPKVHILGVTKNKKQLNQMIYGALIDPLFVEQLSAIDHTLTIAGIVDVPVAIFDGILVSRVDLPSNHEEADTIIVQHAVEQSELGKTVKVVSDDTDVFALLTYFYWERKCSNYL